MPLIARFIHLLFGQPFLDGLPSFVPHLLLQPPSEGVHPLHVLGDEGAQLVLREGPGPPPLTQGVIKGVVHLTDLVSHRGTGSPLLGLLLENTNQFTKLLIFPLNLLPLGGKLIGEVYMNGSKLNYM